VRIAFIGFGEVAAAFSAALVGRGAQVSAYDVRAEKRAAAERLGVSFADLPEALRGAQYVLSTVTTGVAREAAEQCTRHLGPGHTYLDLNATSPERKKRIGELIAPSGAAFVEGAVLGAVGVTGAATEILLGGPHARRAELELAGELKLNARFYSDEIGKASMFKMLRSVFSKGMEALLIEFLVAGARAGIREDLWNEVRSLFATQPFEKVALNWVRTHAGAHARRYEEVKQVVGVLHELGLEPTITQATEAFFKRSGTLGLAPAQSADEVVRFFDDKL
jgi:3-hydroxyisobutyrate dehydrogenase-like beta-hydroxyacid dehydrogenase